MPNPLFIPLCAEYFEAFAEGTKTSELRKFGPRWNERTCTVGRPVTLSRGYGRKNRLSGVVSSFSVVYGHNLPQLHMDALVKCGIEPDCAIAVIGIEVARG